MRISRRGILRGGAVMGGGATVAGAVDGTLVTPSWLETSRHEIVRGRPRRPAARDPADRGGAFRVVQVSDLHLNKRSGSLAEAVLAAVRDADPDLIVLTGDSIDAAAGVGPLGDFLAACDAAPQRLAIVGNWEYRAGVPLGELERLHERHGFGLLVNRSVTLRHGDATVRVTGLDDLCGGRPDAPGALAGADPCDRHLVLAHCPGMHDVLDLPAGHAADLVLAGHTHGGQVCPAGICLVTPPGSGAYVAGWYEGGAAPLFVSRGIGTSLVPVRVGSRPEVAIHDWHLG